MSRPVTALLATLALALSAVPANAGSSVRIDVRSSEGDGVRLSFGTGLVSGLVRAFAPLSIDCDDDRSGSKNEREVRELYLALDRAEEPARGTLDTGDEFFDARRERGKLFLRVTQDDGETVELTMPWTLARCVLGGERISRGELARAFESGDVSLQVVDGDETVSIRVD